MPNRLLLEAARRPALKRFVTRRRITKAVARRFVAGETLGSGIRAAKLLANSHIGAILDYLGEHVENERQADASASAYMQSLSAIVTEHLDSHISVKLTQLGLDLSFDRCHQRMEKICARAAEARTVVAIDMESHHHTSATIEMYRTLHATHSNLVLCLQAYLERTESDVESLLPLKPWIRLCKGAYAEPEEISLDRKDTSENYKRILDELLRNSDYTAVATHDGDLIDHAQRRAREWGLAPDRFEFQMLYGVRRELQADLVRKGSKVRVYVPFGDQWYPYLMRRLAERPANLRFFLEALLRG